MGGERAVMVAIKTLENSSRRLTQNFTSASYTTQGENVIYVDTPPPDSPVLTISDEDIAQQRFPIIIQDRSTGRSPTYPLTINCESGQTINEQTDYTITIPFQCVQINSDGTNCFIQANSQKWEVALATVNTGIQSTSVLDTWQNVILGSSMSSDYLTFNGVTATFLQTKYYDFRFSFNMMRLTAAASGTVEYLIELRIAGARQTIEYGYLGDNTWVAHPNLNWSGQVNAGDTAVVRMAAYSGPGGTSINDVSLVTVSTGTLGGSDVYGARVRIIAAV